MDIIIANLARPALAIGLCVLYVAFCLYLYRRSTQTPALTPAPVQGGTDAQSILLVYASQTGQAEAVARQAASLLGESGRSARVCRLDQPWLEELTGVSQLLFVASTYGDGTAPDHASGFVRQHMVAGPCAALRGMRYGVLALGDRTYPDFCAFGRQLDQWLADSGGIPAFARIDADRLDAASQLAWLSALRGLGAAVTGSAAFPADSGYANWRFGGRRCLNEGSPGAPMFRISLLPPPGLDPVWRAGDLVDLLPPGAGTRARTYSIANLPGSGALELIVRSVIRDDGQPGLASGWLNQQAAETDSLPLRLRHNPGFNLDCGLDTPLILIGAGSGLAGLRGHLQARAKAVAESGGPAPERCAWLFYGEREERYDQPCRAEFAALKQQHVLTKQTLSFSRDNLIRPYVQHALQAHAQELRDWVDAGACFLICGSAHGMAHGVDQALRSILGAGRVDQLTESGRIRRDVF